MNAPDMAAAAAALQQQIQEAVTARFGCARCHSGRQRRREAARFLGEESTDVVFSGRGQVLVCMHHTAKDHV